MADVTQLRQHKERFEPFKPLVEQLEALLEEAKAGRLRAAAVAIVRHDDLTPDAETTAFIVQAPGTYHATSHAIQGLVRRWGRYCDEDIPDTGGRI